MHQRSATGIDGITRLFDATLHGTMDFLALDRPQGLAVVVVELQSGGPAGLPFLPAWLDELPTFRQQRLGGSGDRGHAAIVLVRRARLLFEAPQHFVDRLEEHRLDAYNFIGARSRVLGRYPTGGTPQATGFAMLARDRIKRDLRIPANVITQIGRS